MVNKVELIEESFLSLPQVSTCRYTCKYIHIYLYICAHHTHVHLKNYKNTREYMESTVTFSMIII